MVYDLQALESRRLLSVAAATGEVAVSLESDFGSGHPDLAAVKGTYVVAWDNRDGIDDARDVARAVRFDQQAKRVSKEVVLPAEEMGPDRVISTPTGFATVSKSSVSESGHVIRYFALTGKQLKLPQSTGDGPRDQMNIGSDGKGSAVLILEDFPDGQETPAPLRVTFLSPDGRIRSGPKRLPFKVPSNAPAGSTSHDPRITPTLAVAPDGSFWVASQVEATGNGYHLLQRYDKQGRPTGPALNLSHWVPGAQYETYMDITPDGGVVAAVYHDNGGSSEESAVTLLRFSKSGKLEAAAYNALPRVSGGAAINVDERGVVFIAYVVQNPAKRDGFLESGLDVMGRTFSADLSSNQKPFLLSVRTDEAEEDPDVVSIGGGRFAVAWMRRPAWADDPEAPHPADSEQMVYTRVFKVTDPKASGKKNIGGGPVTPAEANSLPFQSGWYYVAAHALDSSFVFNNSIAFVRIEGTARSAVVKEVLIPSDAELASAAASEPLIQQLGTGNVFVPDGAEFSTDAIGHRPLVWAPGTTFSVFSFHARQPAFRVKGRLVKFSNVSDPGPFQDGPPRYRVIGEQNTSGPGETSLSSNIGAFNSGQDGGYPDTDQIIYFLAHKGNSDWKMTFYRLQEEPEANLRVVVD